MSFTLSGLRCDTKKFKFYFVDNVESQGNFERGGSEGRNISPLLPKVQGRGAKDKQNKIIEECEKKKDFSYYLSNYMKRITSREESVMIFKLPACDTGELCAINHLDNNRIEEVSAA